jgi:hypothetical protein
MANLFFMNGLANFFEYKRPRKWPKKRNFRGKQNLVTTKKPNKIWTYNFLALEMAGALVGGPF